MFLFPADTGGRIRTSNILRGLKGGAFEVTLLCPADAPQQQRWAPQLAQLCDRLIAWEPAATRPQWRRALDLFDPLPVNVVADRTRAGRTTVHRALASERFDVVVFDFVHAAVLRPLRVDAATVCFTHNVEAEIFERHATQTSRMSIMRSVWASQSRKMTRFESEVLPSFTRVIAVSERDAAVFRDRYAVQAPAVIPTGVDLEYFGWQAPAQPNGAPTVVFTGSMDWAANIDGVGYFIDEIWPRVRAAVANARFVVVGRNPPAALVERSRTVAGVTFTGLVDDVRPYVRDAHAFVIPLRVGGGTRIKAFEAMAMGCPVVSTSIGMEGLGVRPDEHFLLRDDATGFVEAVVALLNDVERRQGLSSRARTCVEAGFGHRAVAQVFENACVHALEQSRSDSKPPLYAATHLV